MGIGLSFIVGWPLLIMGLYCYLIGIFYSSGPKPLSSPTIRGSFLRIYKGNGVSWIHLLFVSTLIRLKFSIGQQLTYGGFS